MKKMDRDRSGSRNETSFQLTDAAPMQGDIDSSGYEIQRFNLSRTDSTEVPRGDARMRSYASPGKAARGTLRMTDAGGTTREMTAEQSKPSLSAYQNQPSDQPIV